jgi:hypothetical protein
MGDDRIRLDYASPSGDPASAKGCIVSTLIIMALMLVLAGLCLKHFVDTN